MGLEKGVESICQVKERGATSGKPAKQNEQMVYDLFSTRTGKLNSDGSSISSASLRFWNFAEYVSDQHKQQRRQLRESKNGKAVDEKES